MPLVGLVVLVLSLLALVGMLVGAVVLAETGGEAGARRVAREARCAACGALPPTLRRFACARCCTATAEGLENQRVNAERVALADVERSILSWSPATAAESLAIVLSEAKRLAGAGITARAWAEATAQTSPGRDRPVGVKRLETVIRTGKARPPLSPRETRALRIAGLLLLPLEASARTEEREHPWLSPVQAERVAADHARALASRSS